MNRNGIGCRFLDNISSPGKKHSVSTAVERQGRASGNRLDEGSGPGHGPRETPEQTVSPRTSARSPNRPWTLPHWRSDVLLSPVQLLQPLLQRRDFIRCGGKVNVMAHKGRRGQGSHWPMPTSITSRAGILSGLHLHNPAGKQFGAYRSRFPDQYNIRRKRQGTSLLLVRREPACGGEREFSYDWYRPVDKCDSRWERVTIRPSAKARNSRL